jgi:hypothetical protein
LGGRKLFFFDIKKYIRGGGIIPTQTPAMTTTASRLLPYTLLVALDPNGNAQGELCIQERREMRGERRRDMFFHL